jgi:hypothetical protein
MKIAVEKGRQTRPDIKLGICGEHGGDPDSVKFCHRIGPDVCGVARRVRVPVARVGGGWGRGGVGGGGMMRSIDRCARDGRGG